MRTASPDPNRWSWIMGCMRTTLLLLSLFACFLGTRIALADCRPSASGTWSMEVRLSPRSGKACWDDIGVYGAQAARPDRCAG